MARLWERRQRSLWPIFSWLTSRQKLSISTVQNHKIYCWYLWQRNYFLLYMYLQRNEICQLRNLSLIRPLILNLLKHSRTHTLNPVTLPGPKKASWLITTNSSEETFTENIKKIKLRLRARGYLNNLIDKRSRKSDSLIERWLSKKIPERIKKYYPL